MKDPDGLATRNWWRSHLPCLDQHRDQPVGQRHPWALAMSAVVTLPVLVYEALLVPAHHSNQMLGVIANALYLCFLTGASVSAYRRR